MIDRNRLIALLAGLVRENSINPDLVAGAPGEGAIAAFLAEHCRRGGLEVEVREVAPARANVIARLRGRGTGPALLLNGHIDTVGVEGMTIDPFGAEIRDGRLYGRGAFDMKGGVAAMVEAAVAAAERGAPSGDVILTIVADEEFASLGTQAVVRDGLLAGVGAAIVTEPTGLDICVAHKGFAWFTVETTGRAARQPARAGGRRHRAHGPGARGAGTPGARGVPASDAPPGGAAIGARLADRGRHRLEHLSRSLPPGDRTAHAAGRDV